MNVDNLPTYPTHWISRHNYILSISRFSDFTLATGTPKHLIIDPFGTPVPLPIPIVSLPKMSYIPGLTLPASIFQSPAISILLPLGLGMASGLIAQPGASKPKSTEEGAAKEAGTWKPTQERYMKLEQPPYRPPPWIFAPAWSALYLLMGYASHRAWVNGMSSGVPKVVENTRIGATVYTIQLGLNLIWMPLFFGLGRPIEALVDIVALMGSVGYLAYVWSKVDEVSSYCMVPYLGWLGFATYLCAGTGYLNGWTTKTREERGMGEVKKST